MLCPSMDGVKQTQLQRGYLDEELRQSSLSEMHWVILAHMIKELLFLWQKHSATEQCAPKSDLHHLLLSHNDIV